MCEVLFRGKDIQTKQYVIGYLDKEKSFESKCLSCGSLNTETHNENYSEECRCLDCGLNLYFHDDNWEHGYIGEERTLIRNNGKCYEVEKDSISISFSNIVDSDNNKIFMSLNENCIGGDLLEGIGQYETFFTSKKSIFETFYSPLNDFVFFNGNKECSLSRWASFDKRYKNPTTSLHKVKLYGDLRIVGIKEKE